jgi:hypothetical protein
MTSMLVNHYKRLLLPPERSGLSLVADARFRQMSRILAEFSNCRGDAYRRNSGQAVARISHRLMKARRASK